MQDVHDDGVKEGGEVIRIRRYIRSNNKKEALV